MNPCLSILQITDMLRWCQAGPDYQMKDRGAPAGNDKGAGGPDLQKIRVALTIFCDFQNVAEGCGARAPSAPTTAGLWGRRPLSMVTLGDP
jgi:hypothetical protein